MNMDSSFQNTVDVNNIHTRVSADDVRYFQEKLLQTTDAPGRDRIQRQIEFVLAELAKSNQ